MSVSIAFRESSPYCFNERPREQAYGYTKEEYMNISISNTSSTVENKPLLQKPDGIMLEFYAWHQAPTFV